MPDYASTQREARIAHLTPYPFESRNGGLGIRLTCDASSGTTSRTALVGSGYVAVVCNTGDVTAYVAFGTSSIVATTSYYPVLPGTKEVIVLSEGEGITHAAGITASGSTYVSVCLGFGV